jgi:hypothetical protein
VSDSDIPFSTENMRVKCVEKYPRVAYLIKIKIVWSDGTVHNGAAVSSRGEPDEYIGEEAAAKWVEDNIGKKNE